MSGVAVVVGLVLLVVGALLVGVAALGLLRLPDVYTRANAVTKAAALGLVLVLLGGLALAPEVGSVLTLVVAVALQLFTVPIAGYEVGQAARLSGAPLSPLTHHDEVGLPRTDDDAGAPAGGDVGL